MRISQQAAGTLQQHPELGRSAGRADMLDDPLPPARGYVDPMQRVYGDRYDPRYNGRA